MRLFLCKTTEEKHEQKNCQKQKKKNYKCWVSSGLSSAKVQQKCSLFGRLACKTFPYILEKGKKMKKWLPSKDKCVVHLNNPFFTGPSRGQFNQDLLDLIDFWNDNQLSRSLGTFRPMVDDHLCLCVFFFRFRLKKQQHLQTDTGIKSICSWEKPQVKQKKEQTWANCLC